MWMFILTFLVGLELGIFMAEFNYKHKNKDNK